MASTYAILKRWITAEFVMETVDVSVGSYVVAPAAYDIVINEAAERELWSSWGVQVWLIQLHAETDALDRRGLLSTMCEDRFLRERCFAIPPSPYGIPPTLSY